MATVGTRIEQNLADRPWLHPLLTATYSTPIRHQARPAEPTVAHRAVSGMDEHDEMWARCSCANTTPAYWRPSANPSIPTDMGKGARSTAYGPIAAIVKMPTL